MAPKCTWCRGHFWLENGDSEAKKNESINRPIYPWKQSLGTWACRTQLLCYPKDSAQTFYTFLLWKSKWSLLNKVKGQHQHRERLQMPPDVRAKGGISCWFRTNSGKARFDCGRATHHSFTVNSLKQSPLAPLLPPPQRDTAIGCNSCNMLQFSICLYPQNNWADVIF